MNLNFLRVAKFVFTLAVAGAAALASACSSSDEIPTITGNDLSPRLNMESVWIIDTRDPEKFDESHINVGGSISVVDMDASFRSAKPEELIVVCGADANDPSAVALAKQLKERGYNRVFVLEGGFAKWAAGGGTVRSMKDIPMMARPPHAR